MKTMRYILLLTMVTLIHCTSNEKPKQPSLAQINPVEDEYFGIKISDPYRYMENLKDSAVLNWIKTNSDYSRSVLNSITGRQKLLDKMKEYDGRRSSYVSDLVITENNKYFYLRRTPEDETGKLYYRNGLTGEETLLYDPETHSADTIMKFAISALSPSIDGSKVAFAIAPNGSERSEIMIMKVEIRQLYPEVIDRCNFAHISWLPDGESFIFNKVQSTDVHDINRAMDSKAYVHIVGSDPSTDKEILSRENYPELGISPEEIPIVFYDKDSKYIYGVLMTVDRRLNMVYVSYKDLRNEHVPWIRLFKPDDEVYDFLTTDMDIYVYTPKGAPYFSILKIPINNPDLRKAEIFIPENPKGKITSYGITRDGFYYCLTENGVSARVFFLPNGEKTVNELELPFPSGSSVITTKGYNFSDAWISLTGWTAPNQRFRYSPKNDEFTPENLSTLPEYPEYADMKVEELMIPSHDDTMVPLSLIYKSDLVKDGNNPVFLLGYGSYGISMDPFFSPNYLLWTYEGGILAVPHVRGGGELGDKWHKGGFKSTKPNTWKDLIACAEYLVKESYTSPQKIAINGASAGGVLVGRALTERPDIFAAAIPEVGCLNLLRSEESPNGPANIPEFGTIKDSLECMALIEMDSYQHVSNGVKYPATLVTAGMNDPRVIAWEPAKFAARLQAANVSNKPILFLADSEAGHGIGDSRTKLLESFADILSFAFWQTGHPDYRTKKIKN